MNILRITLLATLLIAPLSALHATDQPNFIVIFIDDLGYADISPFGKDRHDTPNLDRMAREGRKFTNLMASTIDLLPTFASLAGESFEAKFPIDGIDVSSLFRQELPQSSPRNTFAFYGYFNAEDQYRETEQVLLHAVREGRWKYYPRPTRFLRVGSEEYLEIPRGALYDLDADPGEIYNRANQHPEIVARLKALSHSFVRELGDEGNVGTGTRTAGFVEEGKPINYITSGRQPTSDRSQ